MKTSRINADKPHLWKADIAASVDRFNEWFMRFAAEAFRSTRVKTAEHVKAALFATNDLRSLNADTLKANPAALPTLRMCTAPPLAVDRLIGLASANKSLIGCMEEGKLAVRMKPELLAEHLGSVCRVLTNCSTATSSPGSTMGRRRPTTSATVLPPSSRTGCAAPWPTRSSATLRSSANSP